MAFSSAPRESVASGCMWRVLATDQMEWRQWDDEVVVFNGFTANTHLLGGAAGQVLLALLQAESALTAEQIHLCLFADGAASADELLALDAILIDFERLRIAGRVLP